MPKKSRQDDCGPIRLTKRSFPSTCIRRECLIRIWSKEAIGFSESLKKFEKLGVTVIGVSKDSLESHARFRKKHKLKVALGSDPETKMAKDWGVWGEKSLYGRKYMGMERATFLVNAKGVIEQAWHKVKVPGHVETVLAAAAAL